MSSSLCPHGLQHTGLPCPSLYPRVCSNSCPLSQLNWTLCSELQFAFYNWQAAGIVCQVTQGALRTLSWPSKDWIVWFVFEELEEHFSWVHIYAWLYFLAQIDWPGLTHPTWPLLIASWVFWYLQMQPCDSESPVIETQKWELILSSSWFRLPVHTWRNEDPQKNPTYLCRWNQ